MLKTRNRRIWYTASIATGAVLLGAGGVIALSALSVDVPLFPAVGENQAQACDTDGVTTSFVYGNSSANGMKVTSATVKGIDAKCATATVEFLSAGSPVSSYSANVSAGQATVVTSIFTGQFNDVRVILNP